MTRALRSAVLVAGLALGVFSLAVARGGAGYSFGGSSAFAGAAELPPKEYPAPPRATASENTPSASPATKTADRSARVMRQSWQA